MRDLTGYLIGLEDAVWDKFAHIQQPQELDVEDGDISQPDWTLCAVSHSGLPSFWPLMGKRV